MDTTAAFDSIVAGGQSPPLTVTNGIATMLGRPVHVIEIGASYGRNLMCLAECPIDRLTSVDCMYDWVPDVKQDEPFDLLLVDAAKVDEWHANSRALIPNVDAVLIIGRSWDIAVDPANAGRLQGADILIVDGCHHPDSAVEADYWSFEPFLADEHYAVFDDLTHGDPEIAFEHIREKLGDRLIRSRRIDAVGVLHVCKIVAV